MDASMLSLASIRATSSALCAAPTPHTRAVRGRVMVTTARCCRGSRVDRRWVPCLGSGARTGQTGHGMKRC